MAEGPKRRFGNPVVVALGSAIVVLALTALLVNIFQRQQEARNPFYRVVELSDDVEDPSIWGKNFPQQYDGYKRTVDQVRTRYGGSEALPKTPTQSDPRSVVAQSRLEDDSRLRRCGQGMRLRKTFVKSVDTPTC